MKTLKKFFFLVLFSLSLLSASSQDTKFDVGLKTGVYVPSHWMIQGLSAVNYIDGSPTDLNVMGFGNGAVLNLYAKFFFNDFTGLMLDGGAVLLQSHSEDLSLAPGGEEDMYENVLTMFPVNLSLIYRINIQNSKLSPFLGAGSGVYISQISQKHFPENADRTWLEGKSNPIGIHFFTGFDFPLYHNLIFNFEFKYNYASSDWIIKDQDFDFETKYKRLNIGGIVMKFGIGFKF